MDGSYHAVKDASPAEAYTMFFKGIFGNLNGFMEVFVKGNSPDFTGLGCAVAFRTGFNIGAEGQFYAGALASAWAAHLDQGSGDPASCAPFLMGFVFGGLWALIAAMFKAKLGISEIIVTIMLNYVRHQFPGYCSQDLSHGPGGRHTQSPKLDPSVTLYRFLKPTRLHAGFIIAVLMVFLVWFILERQRWDMKSRWWDSTSGLLPVMGISVVRNIIISRILSGGLAGIAGAVEGYGCAEKASGGEYPGVRIHSGAYRPSGVQSSGGRALCRHQVCRPGGGGQFHADRWGCRRPLLSISWWVLLCY